MTDRREITFRSTLDREEARRLCNEMPEFSRVEFKGPTRSNAQNSRLWPLLDRVARRFDIAGKTFDADDWKVIFMNAMRHDAKFLPQLPEYGGSFFPAGYRSSKLSVKEMADMQTFIEAWCASRGVDIWDMEGEA